MFQLTENLSTIKNLSKEWGSNQRKYEQKELKEIQQKIQDLHSSNTTRLFFTDELNQLRMEEKKHSILLDKEEKISILKSRALWLECGFKNMKYFHRFSSHMRNINTIL